jgi:hypothetical protein
VADWLHDHALSCRELGRNDWAAQSTRAATLLQQLSAIENLKTTNWKARCAELADRLDDALTYTVQSDTERSMRQLITRTRTALAQPEPEGPPMSVPGDAEGLAEVFWGRYEQPEPQGPTERIASIATAVREWAFGWEPTARLIGNVCAEDVADLCGAILTHYTRPTTEPVPVAERPWEREGWCNSDNEAFFFDSDIKKWSLCECDKYSPVMTNASDRYTHSLPHHALPVPGAEVGND